VSRTFSFVSVMLLLVKKYADFSRLTDYAAVVLAIIAIVMAVNWFAFAKKHYQGPRIEISQ
jgi:hypothetical protein